jgi:uncharacterized protein YqeY
MSDLKSQLKDAQKVAMRAKDKARLTVIRGMLAAIKRIEVDERIELEEPPPKAEPKSEPLPC